MIHAPEQEDMQVAQVARNEIPEDLPTPVLEDLVAAAEAFQEQPDATREIASLDDVVAGSVFADLACRFHDRPALLIRQRSVVGEFADQGMAETICQHVGLHRTPLRRHQRTSAPAVAMLPTTKPLPRL